ncbi:MAG TPA: hypothetical protein VGO66_13070 [Solirubrobacterales bacterium]|nr:hypothetical protein [Solirubrobacterales bacterium]
MAELILYAISAFVQRRHQRRLEAAPGVDVSLFASIWADKATGKCA